VSKRFAILLHPEALEDLRRLDTREARKVLDAIGERLAVEPALYGKPLGGSLAGLRRVRVGDLRVVYRILDDTVELLIVQNRKVVYEALARRWGTA
jgi:mRNA interferase RelE/StbE